MWAWFMRWLRGNSHRRIFRYWDGRRYKLGDPIELFRSILNDGEFSWDATPALMEMEWETDDQLRVRMGAMKTASDMVRRVFGIRPLADRGLTDKECLALLWEFESYVGAVKKNGRSSQTSPPSTGSSQREPRPDSASGSIGSEAEPGIPTGRPEESETVSPVSTA